MRAIWKGSISFGLVNIPVALQNATRTEELKFRLLRARDLSPVNYRRVAAVDGEEVPWNEIVKGYEYEKGRFVVLKDEDFRRVDVEAADTIDIVDFVAVAEINPWYFHRPYYLEPGTGGAGAYALLCAVLRETGKAGIARIVIRTRQHLAAVKADGNLLVLELLRFADELVAPTSIKVPAASRRAGTREVRMAKALVDQMTQPWDPNRYTDDYRSSLLKLIERKVAAGGRELPGPARRAKPATNVIDLASVLRRSLEQGAPPRRAARPARRRGRRRAA